MANAAVPVPEADARRLVEYAQGARLDRYILDHVGDPVAGSNFDRLDKALAYPYESVPIRAGAYLKAALDHLAMWADFFAPMKFHPDQLVLLDYRPTYTIARAAMESAAQADWILSTNDERECLRRHYSLVRWDLEEYRKSAGDQSTKDAATTQDALLLEFLGGSFSEKDVAPPGGYLNVFRSVCKSPDFKREIGDVERLWRAASGAAHGMFWVGRELQVPASVVIDGLDRTVYVPDVDGMVEVLKLAAYMVRFGVGKFAYWSGADPMSLGKEAFAWLVENIPLRDDLDPAEVQLRRQEAWSQSPYSLDD